MRFADMNDEQLKGEALAGQGALNADCFSTHDLLNMEGAMRELERRGYEVREETQLVFVKQELDFFFDRKSGITVRLSPLPLMKGNGSRGAVSLKSIKEVKGASSKR